VTAGTVTKRAAWWIPVTLLVAILLAWHFLPARLWVLSIAALVERLGAWGIAIYAIMYIGGVIFLAPAEIMSIAGGLIFGLWGIPLVIVLAAIGATFDFLISRYLLRAQVRVFVQKRAVLEAVDRAVKEESWKLVLLLRLNPLVPFNLQNYVFGVTDIGLLPYAAATFFGIMPGTAAYVYLGTLGRLAAAGNEPSGLKIASLGVALVATVLLAWIAGRRTKAMLENLQGDTGRA
jgi:uncharacterized membrane protein YdjX (TVP38/TMEM64 family)